MSVSLTALYAPPREIKVADSKHVHAVPRKDDEETRVLFQQWLTLRLPSTAQSTIDPRNGNVILGMPNAAPTIAEPGDFVSIDSVAVSVVRYNLEYLVLASKLDRDFAYVLAIHQHRQLRHLASYQSALLSERLRLFFSEAVNKLEEL